MDKDRSGEVCAEGFTLRKRFDGSRMAFAVVFSSCCPSTRPAPQDIIAGGDECFTLHGPQRLPLEVFAQGLPTALDSSAVLLHVEPYGFVANDQLHAGDDGARSVRPGSVTNGRHH